MTTLRTSHLGRLMNPKIYEFLATLSIFVVASLGIWQVWGWVMPEFGLPKLNYFQFVGFYGIVQIFLTPLDKIVR